MTRPWKTLVLEDTLLLFCQNFYTKPCLIVQFFFNKILLLNNVKINWTNTYITWDIHHRKGLTPVAPTHMFGILSMLYVWNINGIKNKLHCKLCSISHQNNVLHIIHYVGLSSNKMLLSHPDLQNNLILENNYFSLLKYLKAVAYGSLLKVSNSKNVIIISFKCYIKDDLSWPNY